MEYSQPAAILPLGLTLHLRTESDWTHQRENDFAENIASGIFPGDKTIGGGTSRIQV